MVSIPVNWQSGSEPRDQTDADLRSHLLTSDRQAIHGAVWRDVLATAVTAITVSRDTGAIFPGVREGRVRKEVSPPD